MNVGALIVIGIGAISVKVIMTNYTEPTGVFGYIRGRMVCMGTRESLTSPHESRGRTVKPR